MSKDFPKKEDGPGMNGQTKSAPELSLVKDEKSSSETLKFFDLKIGDRGTDLWFCVNEELNLELHHPSYRTHSFRKLFETETNMFFKPVRKRKN